ncbi:MAG TPA: isopentenyl-diphosphate Delta-isomerase [Candidatus Acidoferrum sp.]|nr:isopentenyl-diphosphate Delta-isomerase [Candidatus Acidoferrum sp.]
MTESEQIIFVTEDGQPTGETGPKLASHTANTRVHLAFSCYVFRSSDNKFLLTQRALSKKVWPGVWTNSFCGHPMPGEAIEAAVRRRGQFELGLDNLKDITCVLPVYRYTTPPYNGIIENEFCPVFVAYTSEEPRPNPSEVEAYQWVTWPEYVDKLHNEPEVMSYWAKDVYPHLIASETFAQLARLA